MWAKRNIWLWEKYNAIGVLKTERYINLFQNRIIVTIIVLLETGWIAYYIKYYSDDSITNLLKKK